MGKEYFVKSRPLQILPALPDYRVHTLEARHEKGKEAS